MLTRENTSTTFTVAALRKLLLIIPVVVALTARAQVNEPTSSTVYDYLYRMAQKGFIAWDDYQLPLDRMSISRALEQLVKRDSALTRVERSELLFYRKDFAFDSLSALPAERYHILRKDAAGRFRTVLLENENAKVFLDPVAGLQYLTTGGRHNLRYFSGARVAGYFGQHWGINVSFSDHSEKGDTINHNRSFTPEQGTVITRTFDKAIDYSTLEFNLGYRWQNGALSIGKDNLVWGYGKGGNIVLSGKAPSFPYIRFSYRPWRWLQFDYFHGWLMSNIVDSTRTYNTGTGVASGEREIYRSKFIANHSITVTPVKGLDIALGESMVYSDELNIAYLVPVNFFKGYDHYTSRYNLTAGSNSQFFGMISSRNQLKNTHLYAQLFIDELSISKILNEKEKRNQLGYTVGASRTDLFVPYLTLGAEYTRMNPFVYNNLIPAQTYESHSFPLGDWMGNNADRLYLFAQYTPVSRMKLKLWRQAVRKGSAGTLWQQYFQQPQPPFLFDKLFEGNEWGFSLRYEWIHKLQVFTEAIRTRIQFTGAPRTSRDGLKFGVTYGL